MVKGVIVVSSVHLRVLPLIRAFVQLTYILDCTPTNPCNFPNAIHLSRESFHRVTVSD